MVLIKNSAVSKLEEIDCKFDILFFLSDSSQRKFFTKILILQKFLHPLFPPSFFPFLTLLHCLLIVFLEYLR